jgi:hypothetical protein
MFAVLGDVCSSSSREEFLDAFEKLRKATVSFVISV